MPWKFNPFTGKLDKVRGATDLSGYVPYTGATSDVNLGSHNLITTGTIGGVNVTSGSNPGHTHTVSAVSDIDTQIKRLSFLTS